MPQTLYLSSSETAVSRAAHLLATNHLVAFPTETVYGLGANARSDQAVQGIFRAKGRPSDNPLIVHVSSAEKAFALAQAENSEARNLAHLVADHFWPGPLTMIMKSDPSNGICDKVRANLPSIGIRVPSNRLALSLLEQADCPVAAPSANLSGKPSPTKASHVVHDLNSRIHAVLDGGSCDVGVESTVVDTTQLPFRILRPGGVTAAQIATVIGKENICDFQDSSLISCDNDQPRAPGMKYVHYAPDAPVYFLKHGTVKDCQAYVDSIKRNLGEDSIAVLTSLPPSALIDLKVDVISQCGEFSDAESVARDLYARLRSFDEGAYGPIGAIICYGFPETGVGAAVLNRLLKASLNK